MLIVLVSLKDCCDCHSFSITEQHCNWLVIKLLAGTCFLGRQKLVIPSLQGFFFQSFLAFPSCFFNSTNCIDALVKNLLNKGRAFERIAEKQWCLTCLQGIPLNVEQGCLWNFHLCILPVSNENQIGRYILFY